MRADVEEMTATTANRSAEEAPEVGKQVRWQAMMMKTDDDDSAKKNERHRKESRPKLQARKPEARDAADSEPTSSDPADANTTTKQFAPSKVPEQISNGSQSGATPVER